MSKGRIGGFGGMSAFSEREKRGFREPSEFSGEGECFFKKFSVLERTVFSHINKID